MKGTTRPAVGVATAVIVGVLVGGFAAGQAIETRLIATVLHAVTGWHLLTVPRQAVIVFPSSFARNASAVGLQLTAECSALIMVIPVIVAGGIIGSIRRFPLPRVATAVVVAVATVVATNQLRIDLIIVCIRWLGLSEGYPLSHVYLGSVLAIVGFVIAAALFVKVISSGGRPEVAAR